MKRKMIPFVLLISYFMILSSCKKEREIIVPLSKIAKQYCDFKAGSYWVYQDSISGEIDSIYLFKRNEVVYGNGEVKSEKIFYDCYSSFLQKRSPNSVGDEPLPRELTVTNFPRKIADSINTVFYASRYYMHQLYSDSYQDIPDYGDGATSVVFVKKHDSLDINTIRFYHVKEFTNNQMRSFFAKNIGLIQFYDPYPNSSIIKHNWKLIRYYIE